MQPLLIWLGLIKIRDNYKLIIRNNQDMNNIDDLKKKVKRHAESLEELGVELSKIQFNFKVLNKTESEYWEKRIADFKIYHEKAMEYYTEIYLLMNLIDKEKGRLFLLNMSQLRQIGTKLTEIIEKVKENPSVMSSKDKQQSKWSKNLREQLIEYSNKNLQLEKETNIKFREFYDKHLKSLLE